MGIAVFIPNSGSTYSVIETSGWIHLEEDHYAATQKWKNLQLSLRTTQSLNTFRKELKSHLFANHFKIYYMFAFSYTWFNLYSPSEHLDIGLEAR